MTQSLDQLDRLVEDYLGAVSYACRDLPPERRNDLVGDLREHIAAARAVLYQPTEAAVRTILDRLGEPAAIAAEARLAEGLDPVVTASPPVREVNRDAPPNRWMSRPMPPALVAFLATLAIIAVTLMVLGFLIATREPAAPLR
jgi:uncharacterized membrane protein